MHRSLLVWGMQGAAALGLEDLGSRLLGFNVFSSSGGSWGGKNGKCLFFKRNLSSGLCFGVCIQEGQPLSVLPE